jgi:ABC-2 type transport system permease protein
MKILKALIIKESLQIIRDPSTILIAAILPLILLFIFGYGVNLDNSVTKIGLVLEESTPQTRSLAASFQNSRFLNVTVGHDRREFYNNLTIAEIRGIIVIPHGFTAASAHPNKTAKIQVITDGSEPLVATSINSYAHGVVQTWLKQETNYDPSKKSINIIPRYWYNPELKSKFFLVPGSISIIMTLIGTLLTALVIAREWERGTMEAMMATPISVPQILLGKIIPYFALGIGSMVICSSIATFFYGVPFRGSFLLLIIATSIFLFSALSQGLLISTIAKDQFVASQIALSAGFLPAFMLSGFIFEIASMPLPIQFISYVIPARYFVTSLQTIFLTGNVWPLIIPMLGAILFIGLILFLIILFKTSKRLDV